MPLIAVHYLPQFVAESDLAGSVVIVVDLLRASTTICQALANGAECVVPSVEVDETFAKAEALLKERGDRQKILLGGERGGQQIEGFDLGNSPLDYTAEQVFGQTVLFTSTNGTKALAHARLARRTLIGCAVNRGALVEEIADAERIDILCAGTGGTVTREDILAAGAIVDRLEPLADARLANEWADAAHREWRELLTTGHALGRTPSEQFALELQNTLGGKNLLALGYDRDLPFCAQLDVLDVAAELDRSTGEIKLP